MADKIDQIKIGSTTYDIDLPADATPSIASILASTTITANTFKKSGGTGTQFLMADGSVKSDLYYLKSGNNCTVSTNASNQAVINTTNTNTWDALTSSSQGYLYEMRRSTGATPDATTSSYFRIAVSSSVKLLVAYGTVTGLSVPNGSSVTGTVNLPKLYEPGASTQTNFFPAAPVVMLSFGNESSSVSVHVEITSYAADKFGYALIRPSGAVAVSNCKLFWIATYIVTTPIQ